MPYLLYEERFSILLEKRHPSCLNPQLTRHTDHPADHPVTVAKGTIRLSQTRRNLPCLFPISSAHPSQD